MPRIAGSCSSTGTSTSRSNTCSRGGTAPRCSAITALTSAAVWARPSDNPHARANELGTTVVAVAPSARNVVSPGRANANFIAGARAATSAFSHRVAAT